MIQVFQYAVRISETSVNFNVTTRRYISRLWTSYSPPWEPEISHAFETFLGRSHFLPTAVYFHCLLTFKRPGIYFDEVCRDLEFKSASAELSDILIACYLKKEPGSSVSTVPDYGLDDRAFGVRSPAGAKDFSSSLCVQTGSEAHPASCTLGTGGPFPGAKRGRGVTLTTHPHLVPRSRMSRSYTSSPPSE
jgi:hypothetical protein